MADDDKKQDEATAAVDASVEELTGQESAGESPNSEVDQLKAQLTEANERVLRTQAELENFRRRTKRELDDSIKYSNQPLINDLLPVIDNIDRAVEAAQQNAEGAGLLEGVKMVAQQLISVFEKHHCKPIPAMGEPFDPTHHEAIGQQPSDEIAQGMVMLVAQQGYQLHDRIVRPSQVIVSTGSANQE